MSDATDAIEELLEPLGGPARPTEDSPEFQRRLVRARALEDALQAVRVAEGVQHTHDGRGTYSNCPACGTDWRSDEGR